MTWRSFQPVYTARPSCPERRADPSGRAVEVWIQIHQIHRQDRVDTERPNTLWNTVATNEYGFYANVNPEVDHPRWSQASERRIGELSRRPTLMFNGYGEQSPASSHLRRHGFETAFLSMKLFSALHPASNCHSHLCMVSLGLDHHPIADRHIFHQPHSGTGTAHGRHAITLLLLSLLCTPLNTLFKWSEPLKRRRTLGLYAFLYADHPRHHLCRSGLRSRVESDHSDRFAKAVHHRWR
jgi:hypothetical protein